MKDFEYLVDNYKNIVYSLCYGIVRDPHTAADISQEVFIKAYLSINSYQNQGFKTWISRISVNKSIDYVRKMAKEQANCTYLESSISASQSLEEQSLEPAHHETPESLFFKKVRREEINEACNKLNVQYKSTVLKYYFENKSYSQIAQEENISVKTVESRLYRAKKLLRLNWEEDT